MKLTRLTLALCATALFASCNNESTNSNTPDSTGTTGHHTIREEQTGYTMDSMKFTAFLAYEDSQTALKPAILVVPEWWGLTDYAKNRAKQLAELGYVAMAIDVYGNGKIAGDPKEAMSLATPFYANPQLSKDRLDAALAVLKKTPGVDTTRLAAIGYCFGGSFVLNAAKLGADLDGVVSFHGGLAGPAPDKKKLKAQILVCHGGADAMVPAADSLTFRNGLDSVGAVYTFKTYPGAKHAFTNPEADANAKKFGIDIAYNAAADTASWNDMKAFFTRIFQ